MDVVQLDAEEGGERVGVGLVEGSGFGGWGSGFGVLWFRVQGSGFRVYGVWFRV